MPLAEAISPTRRTAADREGTMVGELVRTIILATAAALTILLLLPILLRAA